MKNFISFFILIMCLGAFSPENLSAQADVITPTQIVSTDVRGYTLGAGDVIEVKVMGDEAFNGIYTVDEDGKIAIPFADNPIQAGCRTEREVAADVAMVYKKYLKNPRLNLRVTERHSRQPATVYGEVRTPQRVEMQRRARLQELLAFSGGATEKAGGTVEVWHTQTLQCAEPGDEADSQANADGGNFSARVFKLSDVNAGKGESNPYVRPGDVIVVQKAPPIFIVGEVRLLPQDGISIQEGGLTLTEAIARVGGVTREAKKKDVRIYRLPQGAKNPNDTKNRETISRNLDLIKKGQQKDEVLQPYDIIEVEKAPKSLAQIVLDIATGSIKNAANVIPQTAILR